MELLVNLENTGDLARSEAQQVIARLQRQNITQYNLIPNADNPTAIRFSYDGRMSKNQSVESSNRQYNDVRDGGTFVSMQQILTTILAKHGKPTKKGDHRFARVPIHIRTRAQPGQPTQTLDTIFRTINNKGIPEGSWIALLQNNQYQKHLNNEVSPQNLPTPNDIKQQLGLTEPVSIINDDSNINPFSNSQNQLNSPNIPEDNNGYIPPLELNNIFENQKSRLMHRPNQR